MCDKESALSVTTKQQATGTPIFTSMYVLHAYTALGLYMCTASIVFTDSGLAHFLYISAGEPVCCYNLTLQFFAQL